MTYLHIYTGREAERETNRGGNGMTTWELTSHSTAENYREHLDELLKNGWEPFAVTYERVGENMTDIIWFRRRREHDKEDSL